MMKYLPTVIQDRLGTCLLGGGGLLEAQEARLEEVKAEAKESQEGEECEEEEDEEEAAKGDGE